VRSRHRSDLCLVENENREDDNSERYIELMKKQFVSLCAYYLLAATTPVSRNRIGRVSFISRSIRSLDV